jgi:ribose transport system substrate-binding protein
MTVGVAATLVAVMATTAACGSDSDSSSAGSGGSDVAVAVLVGGASNAYQAAGVEAVKKAASDMGVKVDVFDAAFDATKQYAQFQTAITSGKYDGILIDPEDGSGVVPLVAQAKKAGIDVAAWNQPIGSDFSSPEPTVDGVVAQAMLPVEVSGRISGELVKKACAEAAADPCEVAALYYKKGSTYDTAIMKGFSEATADDPSIKVVAEADTGATREGGLAAAQTILTGHPGVDVMIGTSQSVTGAVPAVKDADQHVYLIGQALTKEGAQAVADGELFGGTQAMAGEEGKLAFEQLVNAIQGKPVTPAINPGELLKSPCVDGVVASNVQDCSFDFSG